MIRETAKNSLRGFWGTFVLSILATVAVQAVVSSLLVVLGLLLVQTMQGAGSI